METRVAQMERRTVGRPVGAVITASEADRLFRRAKGTAAASYRAGMLRGEQRRGSSRTGYVVYIRTEDAQRLWGGAIAADMGEIQ